MENCKEFVTLIATNCYMVSDEARKQIDVIKYRWPIGSFLYLTASMLDIQLSVYMCARFQSNPRELHNKTEKRILMYLKGTINVGLWHPCNSKINLNGFLDFDFASCKLDWKIISGICHLLGSSFISWNNTKQICVYCNWGIVVLKLYG